MHRPRLPKHTPCPTPRASPPGLDGHRTIIGLRPSHCRLAQRRRCSWCSMHSVVVQRRSPAPSPRRTIPPRSPASRREHCDYGSVRDRSCYYSASGMIRYASRCRHRGGDHGDDHCADLDLRGHPSCLSWPSRQTRPSGACTRSRYGMARVAHAHSNSPAAP